MENNQIDILTKFKSSVPLDFLTDKENLRTLLRYLDENLTVNGNDDIKVQLDADGTDVFFSKDEDNKIKISIRNNNFIDSYKVTGISTVLSYEQDSDNLSGRNDPVDRPLQSLKNKFIKLEKYKANTEKEQPQNEKPENAQENTAVQAEDVKDNYLANYSEDIKAALNDNKAAQNLIATLLGPKGSLPDDIKNPIEKKEIYDKVCRMIQDAAIDVSKDNGKFTIPESFDNEKYNRYEINYNDKNDPLTPVTFYVSNTDQSQISVVDKDGIKINKADEQKYIDMFKKSFDKYFCDSLTEFKEDMLKRKELPVFQNIPCKVNSQSLMQEAFNTLQSKVISEEPKKPITINVRLDRKDGQSSFAGSFGFKYDPKTEKYSFAALYPDDLRQKSSLKNTIKDLISDAKIKYIDLDSDALPGVMSEHDFYSANGMDNVIQAMKPFESVANEVNSACLMSDVNIIPNNNIDTKLYPFFIESKAISHELNKMYQTLSEKEDDKKIQREAMSSYIPSKDKEGNIICERREDALRKIANEKNKAYKIPDLTERAKVLAEIAEREKFLEERSIITNYQRKLIDAEISRKNLVTLLDNAVGSKITGVNKYILAALNKCKEDFVKKVLAIKELPALLTDKVMSKASKLLSKPDKTIAEADKDKEIERLNDTVKNLETRLNELEHKFEAINAECKDGIAPLSETVYKTICPVPSSINTKSFREYVKNNFEAAKAAEAIVSSPLEDKSNKTDTIVHNAGLYRSCTLSAELILSAVEKVVHNKMTLTEDRLKNIITNAIDNATSKNDISLSNEEKEMLNSNMQKIIDFVADKNEYVKSQIKEERDPSNDEKIKRDKDDLSK